MSNWVDSLKLLHLQLEQEIMRVNDLDVVSHMSMEPALLESTLIQCKQELTTSEQELVKCRQITAGTRAT